MLCNKNRHKEKVISQRGVVTVTDIQAQTWPFPVTLHVISQPPAVSNFITPHSVVCLPDLRFIKAYSPHRDATDPDFS